MRIASDVKKSEEIEKLAMHVSENFDWCLKIEEHGLLWKDFRWLLDEELDCFEFKFYGLTPLAVFHMRKLRNHLIQRIGFLCISSWLWERQLIILVDLVFFLNLLGLFLS